MQSGQPTNSSAAPHQKQTEWKKSPLRDPETEAAANITHPLTGSPVETFYSVNFFLLRKIVQWTCNENHLID